MNPYQKYLLEEFADDYHERRMSRRDLVRRAVLIMGSVPSGMAALAAVGCSDDDDDREPAGEASPRAPTATASTPAAMGSTSSSPAPSGSPAVAAGEVDTEDISFDGPGSKLLGYVARPKAAGTYPGVVVIHENRGLVEHIKDVARRYAGEGFITLAVDLVSRSGGSKADTAANTGFLGSAKIEDLVADMVAYVEHAQGLDGVKEGGVGVTGFCFGGGYTWEAAIASEQVKAAIPFYGHCRLVDELATTRAAVLAIYGQLDTRITGEAEQIRAELEKGGQPFEIKVYEGANHAFFNDTGANYNAEAAADAWAESLAWFREHLA